jgi:hypothetical protein
MKAHTHTHTSGPFPLVMHISDSDNVPHLIVTYQGNHFASTYDPSAARLIAAAPDLLAALRDCLPIVDAMRRKTGGEGDTAAMNARAAISKAEGGAE